MPYTPAQDEQRGAGDVFSVRPEFVVGEVPRNHDIPRMLNTGGPRIKYTGSSNKIHVLRTEIRVYINFLYLHH